MAKSFSFLFCMSVLLGVTARGQSLEGKKMGFAFMGVSVCVAGVCRGGYRRGPWMLPAS